MFCLADVRRSGSCRCSEEVCQEFVGQGKRIVWTPSKPLRQRLFGYRRVLIVCKWRCGSFRAEGKQHKDDELHHFYDLMHPNEQQTPELDQSVAASFHTSNDTVTAAEKSCANAATSRPFSRGTRLLRIGPNRPWSWWLNVPTVPALAARIKRPSNHQNESRVNGCTGRLC